MTDRLKGFVITLEDTIREDDAEAIINAIRHIKGVKTIDPVPAGAGISDWLTRTDTLRDLHGKIDKLFQREWGP